MLFETVYTHEVTYVIIRSREKQPADGWHDVHWNDLLRRTKLDLCVFAVDRRSVAMGSIPTNLESKSGASLLTFLA